jgi:HAD superfamily hydrolase (TIGR01509 family)
MTIRALIFDFNGVLADDDPIHERALQQVAEEEGLGFSHQEYLDVYLPRTDRDCFKTLFAKHSRTLTAARLEEMIQRKSVYYFRGIAGKSVLFDGAAEAVRAAAARCPLAIASGARIVEIQHILERAEIQGRFAVIVSAEDVQRGKPHPEPFLMAHQRLCEKNHSLRVYECLAIEDSIGGIQSAHEAGMRCLGITHSYDRERLAGAKPEWIIASIRDFVPWLEREVPSEHPIA